MYLGVSPAKAEVIDIDFTSSDWINIDSGNPYSFTYGWGTITLNSNTGSLTFNGGDDASGCGAPQTGTDDELESVPYSLACDGDGIGIGDDEITQGGVEILTVSFDQAVDILDIHLLDLFIDDVQGGDGPPPELEVAVMSFDLGDIFINASGNTDYPGGYWESSWDPDWAVQSGITSFTLTGNIDGFSDYALARIQIATNVPEPAMLSLLGVALIGLGFARRRRNCNILT